MSASAPVTHQELNWLKPVDEGHGKKDWAFVVISPVDEFDGTK
ncbi:hypothetical protein [Paraburkholderia strydomiana]